MIIQSVLEWLWDQPATAAAYCLLSVSLYFVYTGIDWLIVQPYQRYRIIRRQNIPGPPFIPVIGHSGLRKSYADRHRIHQLGIDFRRQYGPVTHYMIGPHSVLHMSDPDYILAAWKAQRNSYEKSDLTKGRLVGLLGLDSLLLVDERRHAKHRKMLAPAFHFHQLKSMMAIICQQTQKAIDRIAPPSSASPSSSTAPTEVELSRFWTSLTFAIITSCAFGTSLDHIPDASAIVHHSLTTVFSIMQKRSMSLIAHLPILRSLPILGKRESEKGVADMQRVVMQMVRDRQEGRSQSQCEGGDLLDLLLNAKDAETGEGFTAEQIRDEAMTFVVGGHETTSSLMTWAMRDLLSRPSLYRQCREEVQCVTGGGPLQSNHLASLTLIDACLYESFRLHPPALALLIQATSSHYLTPADPAKPPLFIPAGTHLSADLYTMQRSTEAWGETATEYNEQRWIKGSLTYNKGNHAIAFNGFSVGSRNCIGSQFAMMEAKAMLAMVVQQLDMELVEGQEDDDLIVLKLTIEPKNGVHVRVKRAAVANETERKE